MAWCCGHVGPVRLVSCLDHHSPQERHYHAHLLSCAFAFTHDITIVKSMTLYGAIVPCYVPLCDRVTWLSIGRLPSGL